MTRTLQVAANRMRRVTYQAVQRALSYSALVAAIGCAGDTDSSTAPTSNKPAGTYVLRQVDGAGVPKEVYHGPYFDATAPRPHFFNQLIVTVAEGRIELGANGQYTLRLKYAFDGDGEKATRTVDDAGEYVVAGTDIRLQSNDGFTMAATLQNGTVELLVVNLWKEGKPPIRCVFQR